VRVDNASAPPMTTTPLTMNRKQPGKKTEPLLAISIGFAQQTRRTTRAPFYCDAKPSSNRNTHTHTRTHIIIIIVIINIIFVKTTRYQYVKLTSSILLLLPYTVRRCIILATDSKYRCLPVYIGEYRNIQTAIYEHVRSTSHFLKVSYLQ